MGRRRQADRSQATITELVTAASELFGQHGYAKVSIDEVAQRADVTKGAVYHHFDGKPRLFAAVFTRSQQHLTRQLAAEARTATDSWDALRRGTHAFLRACLQPELRRIVVLDGPAVLDRQEIRQIEDEYVGALLVAGLDRAQRDGVLRSGDTAVRSRLILAVLCEAALALAHSTDPTRELTRICDEVDILLAAYRS